MTEQRNQISELNQDLQDLEEMEQKQRRMLAQLLDRELAKRGQFVAFKGEMGEIETLGKRQLIPSYSVVHTLDWIGTFLKMGSDMPLMQSKIDHTTGRIMVDEENAEELQQRAPDWTRQIALTAYLIHSKNRKFSTILAVISPSWIDDPKHEYWDESGRALRSAIEFQSLDSGDHIGIIDVSDVHLYALDGQHRVMGIRGVKDLSEGKLVLKKRSGIPSNKVYTREDFLNEFHSDLTHLQRVLNEKIIVEYIPGILMGETRLEAAQRIRSVFVAINSYAKKTDKGETILLDESDGFSITGRAIGVHHALFKGGKVNFKNTSLPSRSNWYTTLQALRDSTELFLEGAYPEFVDSWQPKFGGQVPMRPEEGELDDARRIMFEYYDYVRSLPVFQGLESGDNLDQVRDLPNEKKPDAKGHLLVRPIGITILAKAVGRLVGDKRMTLYDIFEKLKRFDNAGGFNAAEKNSIFYGVTYSPEKHTMIATTANQKFAAKLLEYMITGAEELQRSELKEEILKEGYRKVDGQFISFDGNPIKVETVSDFDLPLPIK